VPRRVTRGGAVAETAHVETEAGSEDQAGDVAERTTDEAEDEAERSADELDDGVDGEAGEPADEGAVDPDELQVGPEEKLEA
jgi:hypothetical protein